MMIITTQEKFHDLVPALDTWAAYIVPLTLIAIGLLGIYENLNKEPEPKEDEQHNNTPSLAFAGVFAGA